MPTGKFIVIEGTDGSGKGTQFTKLLERLKSEGIESRSFDFPRYEHPSSWFVREYLKGTFGSLHEVDPKTASIFYAMDRCAAGPLIAVALKMGRVVISNRYVASNLGHQGSKMEDPEARRKFFEWDMDLEYSINKIPRPNLNLILHVPAEMAQQLVDKKAARKHLGDKKRDIHEADLDHLKRSEETYSQLAEIYPSEYRILECVEDGRLLSVEEIHEKVWEIVHRLVRPDGFRSVSEALH